MIRVDVKPRQDNKFDITIADDNGHTLLNSDQGYENVEDAVAVVRRVFAHGAAAVMRVEFRDGKTHTEQLR